METLFVYSLVFLCLLGFALFSVLILATDPNRQETASAPEHPSHPASVQENLIVYGVLAALFLFFVVITTMQSRERRFHF